MLLSTKYLALFIQKVHKLRVASSPLSTFDIIGRGDIGQVFYGLRFGMTTADFHAYAKQFDANKELIRLVMTGREAGRLSLSTLADTRTLCLMGYSFQKIFK